MLVYTGSKVIEMVELESKLHSQQCFWNPQKQSVQEQPNIILDAIM